MVGVLAMEKMEMQRIAAFWKKTRTDGKNGERLANDKRAAKPPWGRAVYCEGPLRGQLG
jgi:hypothetical protein